MADTRRPLISGNWKMHHNHFEAIQAVQKLAYLVSKETTDGRREHPPAVHRPPQHPDAHRRRRPAVRLGAQHCHWEDTGAFTGEVSPAFLAKLDVKYVVAGHSERRELFGETDDMVEARCRRSRSTA